MANDLNTRYSIELQLKNSDKVNAKCLEIDRSLEAISKNARGLKFKEALQGVEALENQMHELLKSEGDCTKEWAEFDRASTKAYSDLEKEAVKLNFSLSEQGRLQRERLKELESERASLGKTKEEKARARDLDKEIKEIRKQVVVASDSELKDMQKANIQARARLKLLQNESKQQKTQGKEQKKLLQLIKDDLKPLREKIKLQKDFIKSLSTTAGKYEAIKKLSKSAFAVGKTVMKGAGMAAGAVLGLAGAAIASGEGQYTKEQNIDRIKAGGDYDTKAKMLENVYIEAGGSNDEVVDAINRVYNVLGKNASVEEIQTAAAMEIKYPGISKLLMQQNVGQVSASDYVAAANRTRSTQRFSGASREQIQAASEFISNNRQVNFKNASQLELRDLYLALQGSGGFDSDEELQRAFNRFIREQRNSNLPVFELAKKWQTEGKWKNTAYGGTNRTQASNAIRNLDFDALGAAQQVTNYNTSESAAETAAKTARRVEILKDELLLQILQGIEPLLKNGTLQKIFELVRDILESDEFKGFFKLVCDALGTVVNVLKSVFESVKSIVSTVKEIYDKIPNPLESLKGNGRKAMDWALHEITGKPYGNEPSGHAHANGGIATVPSVFGEAGAEIAIPLSPERESRAQQLTAYVNNAFHMSGSETSTMALSSALTSRDWAYRSSRINELNRRLGR